MYQGIYKTCNHFFGTNGTPYKQAEIVLYCIIIIYFEITQDVSDGNAVQRV